MPDYPNLTLLAQRCWQLEGKGYKAYQSLKDQYHAEGITLIFDRIQSDPFAAPSQVRAIIAQTVAQFPTALFRTKSREIALRDYLARQFAQHIHHPLDSLGSGNRGTIAIASIGPEILERSSVWIDTQHIEVRFLVGLPAQGRRILGHQASQLLCQQLPQLLQRSLYYSALSTSAIDHHVTTAEDADWLRAQLPHHGLLAFVANGAILPRQSGVDPRPLREQAIPFRSPPSLQVEFNCPNRGLIQGMGIPTGITLIVGGGFHGKSTLLRAIEAGVYNHIPGDGREFVITEPSAVKIRAEGGRSVASVNISPFINHLPQGRSTTTFSTANASGSTSQAANIMEALEVGARTLLLDEDTCATNFLLRDHRMQQLIAKDQEPITPLIDKIRQLFQDGDVSTMLVMGGSGDYFDVADRVIAMDTFQPWDVTDAAQAIATSYPSQRHPEGGQGFGHWTPRTPLATSIDPRRGRKRQQTKVHGLQALGFGAATIDVSAVEQLVDRGQLKAIAQAIIYAKTNYCSGPGQAPCSLVEILNHVMEDLTEQGFDCLSRFPQGDFVGFRPFELAATLNRLRTLKMIEPP